MKIVQFKDGSFGIRRLNVFGYEFLGRDTTEDYWWYLKKYIPMHAKMTRAEVIDRWKLFRPCKQKKQCFDHGAVVHLEELEA